MNLRNFSLAFVNLTETLACPPGYFACKTGGCILERDRCDGFAHCQDKSDESSDWAGCGKLHRLLAMQACTCDNLMGVRTAGKDAAVSWDIRKGKGSMDSVFICRGFPLPHLFSITDSIKIFYAAWSFTAPICDEQSR